MQRTYIMKKDSVHSPAVGHHQYRIQYSSVKICAVPTVATAGKQPIGSYSFIDFILSQYILLITPAPIKSTIITKKTMPYAMTHTNGSYAYSSKTANPNSADEKNAINIKSADYIIELITCAIPPVPIIFLTAWSPSVVIKLSTCALIDAISSIVVSNVMMH